MIAYLIGYPIGSHRADPNRPRIAQFESSQPLNYRSSIRNYRSDSTTPRTIRAASAGDGCALRARRQR